MHDEYYLIQITASRAQELIQYRTMVRMRLLHEVLRYAVNDCYATTACNEILSVQIQRWETFSADERIEVCELERQRKKRMNNLGVDDESNEA